MSTVRTNYGVIKGGFQKGEFPMGGLSKGGLPMGGLPKGDNLNESSIYFCNCDFPFVDTILVILLLCNPPFVQSSLYCYIPFR